MSRNDIGFGLVESSREIEELGEFIDMHVGGYNPGAHHTWNRETNIPGIFDDERLGFGFWLKSDIWGGLVLKPESTGIELPGIVYIKYFRNASKDFSGRGVAGFMMQQVAPLGRQVLLDASLLDPSATELTVELDTRADSQAQSFFEKFEYEVVDATPLYEENVLDVIMRRTYRLD